MDSFLIGWAAFTATAWTMAGVWVWRGQRSIGFLREEPAGRAAGPRVSFIVAARNEEQGIEAALRSVLAQQYEDFEVIVVNDRSTDQTGAVLAGLSHPRLRVTTVQELPSGWIGKNHALWTGAKEAAGELLVFTDADVVMDPTTLARAVALLERDKLDHLAVAPEVTGTRFWLKTLVSGFTLSFAFYAAPWKARDPKSNRFIGVGAFNLIRKSVYEAIGTHAAFSFSPIDDMVLGQRVKRAGFRQDLRFGLGLLKVEWYPSVAELARGLEKNAFAGAQYRLSWVMGGTAAGLLFQVWPFAAVFLTSGSEQILYGLTSAIIIALAADNNRYHGHPRWISVFHVFSTIFGIYAVWRSAIKALWHGGIEWRGTRYPLSELKKFPL